MKTRLIASLITASLALASLGAASASSTPVGFDVAAKKFKNCTALNKVYKHGVGTRRARDKTSGTPVTTFTRSYKLYKANTHLDRDKDKIACEKAVEGQRS